MKKLSILSFIVIALLFSSYQVFGPGDWQMTDGYSVRFKTKGVSGFFQKMTGKIVFDESNLSAASFKVEIDAASIATGNSLRTWHAKRTKWFNVKQYPKITFVSNRVSKTDKGFSVNGKLNLRGVEKDITIPFTFMTKVFSGQFYILRSDYHVGKTKGLSKMVGDTIRINITVPVSK